MGSLCSINALPHGSAHICSPLLDTALHMMVFSQQRFMCAASLLTSAARHMLTSLFSRLRTLRHLAIRACVMLSWHNMGRSQMLAVCMWSIIWSRSAGGGVAQSKHTPSNITTSGSTRCVNITGAEFESGPAVGAPGSGGHLSVPLTLLRPCCPSHWQLLSPAHSTNKMLLCHSCLPCHWGHGAAVIGSIGGQGMWHV